MLVWHAAAVFPGAGDFYDLYQTAHDGNVYLAETGDADNGAAIRLDAASKKFPLGALSLLHTLFVRASEVNDTISLLVTASGSEYGDVSHTYSLSLAPAATAEEEFPTGREHKIRLHRDLLGRLAQVAIAGNVLSRPNVFEMRLRYIPIREGRYSA